MRFNGQVYGWSDWAEAKVIMPKLIRSVSITSRLHYAKLTIPRFFTHISGTITFNTSHCARFWIVDTVTGETTYERDWTAILSGDGLIRGTYGTTVTASYFYVPQVGDVSDRVYRYHWQFRETVNGEYAYSPVYSREVTASIEDKLTSEVLYDRTGSRSFVVPDNVTEVRVLVVGAGSGGMYGQEPAQPTGASGTTGGAGDTGGFGGGVASAMINVIPGQVIPVTVGSVSSHVNYGEARNVGGDSSFGDFIVATGGQATARGTATLNLGYGDTEICNLTTLPSASCKTCTDFCGMSLNQWVYDPEFDSGGSSRKPDGTEIAGSAGSKASAGYGVGGNGAAGQSGDTTGNYSQVGTEGGYGGFGGGKGDNGGRAGVGGNGAAGGKGGTGEGTIDGSIITGGQGGSGGYGSPGGPGVVVIYI